MNYKKTKIKILFFLILFFGVFCFSKQTFAATYYVDDSATNDSGDGSSGSPKKYIGSGVALLSGSGGDTLIIKDGNYSNSSDIIQNIPNGTSGNYNIIKAENDGGAVVTVDGGLNMDHADAYIQIEGLKFNYASPKVILGNHIKILRSAFQGGPAEDNGSQVQIGTNDYNDTAYILLEDCWAYGSGGRYNFLAYNSNYVVFRRCVVRHDGGWTDTKGDPEAAICNYNSSYVEIQNCIVIDSDLTSYHTWLQAFYIVYNPASPNSTNNIYMRGNIALKVLQNGYRTEGIGSGIPVFTDNIAYDISRPAEDNGFSLCAGSGSLSVTATKCTFGDAYWGTGSWNGGTPSIDNSILLSLSDGDTGGGFSQSYLDRYNNGGSGSCTNCQTYNPQTNGLLYLPRIEAGSTLLTGGQSGGRIGADVTKKIGTSGTLYGESGYNTTTTDNLWPWTNENRIKSDMATVSTRGFCSGTSQDGSSQTLTKYIWEYLGNQIPSDIYGASSDTTPPAAPSGLGVN
jgi:hypothetical protein